MRNFISMLMILALVVTTTTLPFESHAMPHSGTKATQTEAADHNCHSHGEAKADSQKTVQNDNDASGKCCDKGMCKCVGGNCHNSLSKYLGGGGNPLSALSSSVSVYAFDNQLVDSALPNRLKRPPKA